MHRAPRIHIPLNPPSKGDSIGTAFNPVLKGVQGDVLPYGDTRDTVLNPPLKGVRGDVLPNGDSRGTVLNPPFKGVQGDVLLLLSILLASVVAGCTGETLPRGGIVIIGPHITETLFALGQGSRVSAVDSFTIIRQKSRSCRK